MNKEIWIFGADRNLPVITSQAQERIRLFINSWNTHGSPIHPTIEFLENRFIKITSNRTDESISGCSKDLLFNFIKQLGQDLEADFLNRGLVFLKDEKDTVSSVPFMKIDDFHLSNRNMRVFDLTVSSENDFEKKWCLGVFDSWIAKIPR